MSFDKRFAQRLSETTEHQIVSYLRNLLGDVLQQRHLRERVGLVKDVHCRELARPACSTKKSRTEYLSNEWQIYIDAFGGVGTRRVGEVAGVQDYVDLLLCDRQVR